MGTQYMEDTTAVDNGGEESSGKQLFQDRKPSAVKLIIKM